MYTYIHTYIHTYMQINVQYIITNQGFGSGSTELKKNDSVPKDFSKMGPSPSPVECYDKLHPINRKLNDSKSAKKPRNPFLSVLLIEIYTHSYSSGIKRT